MNLPRRCDNTCQRELCKQCSERTETVQQYITMSTLNKHRWANALFQYMFVHIYGKSHNLLVQTPPWVGEQLLNIEPSPMTVKLLPFYERLRSTGQPYGPPVTEAIGHDFYGYGQYHTSYYQPYRKFIQDLLQPKPAVEDRLSDTAIGRLVFRSIGIMGDIIGIHLRRGDYGRLIHYITPVQWYLDWLEKNWERFEYPVLFIASEDRSLVDQFAKYNPRTAESLGVDLRAEPLPTATYLDHDLEHPQPHLMDFFPDWYLLAHCQYLLIPNSTFSFTAAMLSRRLKRCYRSDLPTQQFHEIDVWNTTPLSYDMAENYKHVPGVCLERNPPHW